MVLERRTGPGLGTFRSRGGVDLCDLAQGFGSDPALRGGFSARTSCLNFWPLGSGLNSGQTVLIPALDSLVPLPKQLLATPGAVEATPRAVDLLRAVAATPLAELSKLFFLGRVLWLPHPVL